MATCASSAQKAVRARWSNKCPSHRGKEVVLYCKDCDDLVCADCVIDGCQGHAFEGISNLIPASKQKLMDFITKVELTEIPSIQGQLQAADSDLAMNKRHFKNQIRKIRKQNNTLKKELDKLTETFVKTYQGMEQHNLERLLHYKRDLQSRIDKLDSQIQYVKGFSQSGNNILVYDMSHVIQYHFDASPTKPVCCTPEFSEGKLSMQVIEQLLGELNISAQTQSLNQGNWKAMGEFTPYTGHAVKSIHATAGGEAWLSYYNLNNNKTVDKMLLTDQSGKVKQTLDMDVNVFDFCLSPETGDIWFCSKQDNSIREVKGGKSIIRFTTEKPPRSICVTNDGHVIIGHQNQIVKYTQGGLVICKTSDGTPLEVVSTLHLSECPLTSNLAVVDDNNKRPKGP